MMASEAMPAGGVDAVIMEARRAIGAMTSDLGIQRSAKLPIDQHGETAAIQAAMKADAMLDKGDLDGAVDCEGD